MEKAGIAGKAANDISGILDFGSYLTGALWGFVKCEIDNKVKEQKKAKNGR